MNKNNVLITRMLWLLMILGLSITSAFAQQRDEIPKGQFLDAYTKTQSYQKTNDVYSADASKLSTEWVSNSFSLETVNGNTLYATGQYAANAQLSATSPSIALPAVAQNERLILQINQSYEVESKYDFISVWVNVNGSEKEVYHRSGKTSSVNDYINLTAYAGKQVQLSFRLTADGSDQGNGWQISSVELYKALKNSNGTKVGDMSGAAKAKSMLRASAASTSHSLEILSVNTEAFPEAIFVEFTVKDVNGNFVENLTEHDFTTFDDYSPRMGCKKIMKVSETMQEEVDIVFLVDNSGSMYNDIQKVNTAVDNLLTGLAGKCDARLGLMRFGGYPNCPDYAIKTTNGQGKFFYSLENEKNQFLSEIWSQNHGNDWGYEPYYEILNWAATQNLGYRTNAKKVFILIGDEKVNDGLNNIKCDYSTPSTLTATSVANVLKQQGIQAFFICDIPYSNGEYDHIASETGGLIDDIYLDEYDDVLDAFSEAMVAKYILRYCLDIDPATVDPNIPRTLEITYNNDPATTDTEIYYPIISPSIIRTAATQLLDNTSQPDKKTVQVGATVILNGNTLDYIDCYYKQHYDGSFQSIRKYLSDGIISGGTVTFTFDIPAAKVLTPKVDYFFEATTSNTAGGIPVEKTVASPPYNPDFFAWTFAVLPNLPPSITNVTINPQIAKPCVAIDICATVIDNTLHLADKPILYYRTAGTPSMFIHIEMEPSAPGSNIYCATIPAAIAQAPGVEYYIVAEDNYGTLGLYGDMTAPKTIPISTVPNTTGSAFYIMVSNYSHLIIDCESIEPTDVLEAYFTNDCGDLQLAASTQWNGTSGNFTFTVYGDSDLTDGYKNGFYDGETIYLKLIRNGIDYGLTNSSLVYSSIVPVGNLTSAAGPGVSAISIRGNSIEINNNSTTPSTMDNTDFGASSSPVNKNFRIHNVGCEKLLVTQITVSDNANFTLNYVPGTLIEPGNYYDFSIDYLGLAHANATVTVNTNALNKNPYKFDITGSTSIPDPCVGVILAPNPSPSFLTPTLRIPIANNNTYLYAAMFDPIGNLVEVFSSGSVPAGTHEFYINLSGLVPGTYPIVIYRNNEVCSSKKLIIQ